MRYCDPRMVRPGLILTKEVQAMKILKVYRVFFSPSDTTRTVVNEIAKQFVNYPSEEIDLTRYENRQRDYCFTETDLVIIGAPAYAGRIPAPEAEALSRFRGLSTPAVLVATYGNKAVDDTLMELYKIAMQQEFIPVAVGTFPCQHTFLPELGQHRPDEDDLEVIRTFGRKLRDRLRVAVAYSMRKLDIPGSYPYEKPPMGVFPFQVETSEFCIYCMLCADVCPMQVISHDNPFSIDHSKCIRCGSCLRICPAQAKSFTEGPFAALQEKLRGFVDQRMEPWYMIG